MKRLVSIAIILLMLLSSISAAAYSSGSFSNGDVNRDEVLSIKDATAIQKFLAKLVEFDKTQEQLADVNLDGTVSIKDATYIQEVLAKIKELPEEPTTQPESTEPESTEPESTQPESTKPEPTEPVTTQPATQPQTELSSEIKISYGNNLGWSKVYFYFYSSDGKSQVKEWPGITPSKTGSTGGRDIYSYTIDISKFDRVVFTNGTDKTMDVPLGLSSTGFYPTGKKDKEGKYIVDKLQLSGVSKGKLTTTELEYSSGYKKKIWIYTPAGYSASLKEKYPTVYVADGQNLFSDHKDGYGGWNVDGAVDGLLANTGKGVIAVGIDNGNSKRDSELTPNIGTINPDLPAYEQKHYSNGTGKAYSDFVVNKVMKYVRENYNSSDKREENCIAGSSSGGLEAFYIGMENKDKFGTIGSLSPAFLLFNDSVWNTYLKKFDLKDDSIPKLYLYCGTNDSLEKELYTYTAQMKTRLTKAGFPSSKLKYSIFEPGMHNEQWWRMYFPEVMSLFFGF